MASPYSTGGGGTHFEARVAASCLVAVLCESVVRGLPGEFATSVRTQRASFGDPLDDIIVNGVHQDGRPTELDLQIKTKLTFTENDEEWIAVLKQAWDTFSKATFDPTVHRFGVAIATYNARVDQHYQSVLTWATHSTDGEYFRGRIEKTDYSHKDKQAFVATVRGVLNSHAGRDLSDDELWRFLASFVILHFDFQLVEESRDAASAIDRIRGLLSAGDRSQAKKIWDHLIAKAGELIPVGGGATRATLVEQLARDGFSIGAAPSYRKDIVALQGESARSLGDIKSHLHGLRLHRKTAYEDIREALEDGRFIQIDGEPGTGKSGLLKDLAEELRRDGPVLVLKDTRIHPKGWPAYAHVLGVSADLTALLREFACGGRAVLFIDGIDKITDPAVQLTVNDLLKAIAFDPGLGQWRIVVTVREQNLKHLETWLDPDALKKLPLKTIGLKALDDEELDLVAEQFPRLRPLLSQSGSADIVLRRLFFLDAMLSLAGREGKEQLPATESELLQLWWDLGGSDRADFSPAQHRRNVLLQLAERLLNSAHGPLAIHDLPPEVIGELKSAGILRDKDVGHSVVFTHDIYEEWALCQLLIKHGSDVAAFLKAHAESEALVRPVQLLGTYTLEMAAPEPWKGLYENTGDPSLRPVWQRAILTSPLQSTRATQLLQSVSAYLLDNEGARLKKTLIALTTTEVVPNLLFLDQTLTPEIDPADRAKYAHRLAVPKAATWVRFLDWLMPLVPQLPPPLLPELLPTFTTWQTTFSGRKVRHCRQIGELTYQWLSEAESASNPWTRNAQHTQLGSIFGGRDFQKPLRKIFLSSVGDVPDLGTKYLQDKLADRSSLHLFRKEIVDYCGGFVRHLPKALVDFILGAFLENPADRASRTASYSDRITRELGLLDDHQFYPASPIQLPFLGLLNSNEEEGLRLIRSLCNHSISVWRWVCENGQEKRLTPLPIKVTLPWGEQSFWGDGQTYLWFRGSWGNSAVNSALMALEQWALEQCAKGAPFEEVFRKVIEGNDSVAVLGIGVSLCLAYPGKSLECTLPLVTCSYLWEWDIARLVQEMGTNSNLIGDWHRYRYELEAVRKLNEYPHRRNDLRSLLPYFVCSGDVALSQRYLAAIRSFPERLPITYEQEKESEDYLARLREKMKLFSEQADPKHYKAENTDDGKVLIWNDAPSLKEEKYQLQQQQSLQLNEYVGIVVWAQKSLESGRVEGSRSIEEAVAKAKQWDSPELLEWDDPDDFDAKQRAGAIVGAAYVASRFAQCSSDDPLLAWCIDVFDRAVAAKRKTSMWSSRSTLLSMDPLLFAVHGYGALLARGYEITKSEEALLRLALDPLEGVQSAVFQAAKYFASEQPAFYWLLLELAIAQCVVSAGEVPDHHAIVPGTKEAEFKNALLAKTKTFLTTGAVPDLPAIPLPWIKSDAPQEPVYEDTQGYVQNSTLFLYHVAAKVLFESPLEPLVVEPERRKKLLKMVGELIDFTVMEIVPPFSKSRHHYQGHTPFEWVFDFSAWCGRLCVHISAAEAREVVLDRIFKQDTETALLLMQGVMKSFMIEAAVRRSEISEDSMTVWSEMTDWVFASPEWAGCKDHEHLDREFITCAFAVLFCVSRDFSPLLCGIDPGWPHLKKFQPLLERAVKEFGTHQTLYLGVITLLKRGGYDLLPSPALGWLLQIVSQQKTDQKFWAANGDETVGLLRKLITEKGQELSSHDRKSIILISDILTDNGVRGAGFLHQELLRADKS